MPDGETEVRNVLERVGEPAVIAEEARDRLGIRRAKPGIREYLALLLLPWGGFFYLGIGWFAGAFLLAGSQVWTSREKAIGLLVLPGGLLSAFWFASRGTWDCETTTINGEVVSEICRGMPVWLSYVIMTVLVAAPIWSAFFLADRMRKRAGRA